MSNNRDATVINDRYEIHKRIGRGGMADVFSARDLLLDRQVAIKVLFPEFATDPAFVERFRREAQAAANLSHPNIVNVYDWGKYQSTYFIAMEEVEGRTLAEVLATHKLLTAKQAAEIASEVAAAMGFAHEKGVAHRDIKPANILIGSNGQVKVADFGIARVMNTQAESNLTQVGSVMGTATYFSPEQAQGAQPDPRSDLYSLGIVMYEMVAGRPPFTGDSPVSIAYKQVHDAPQPLHQIVPDVPRAYEAIVARLLAKNPAVRYPTAGALRDDLRRFRKGEPVEALAAAASAQGRSGSATAGAATGSNARAGAAAGVAGAAVAGAAVAGRAGSAGADASTTAPPHTNPGSAGAAGNHSGSTASTTAVPESGATQVSPVNPQAAAVPSAGMYEAGYPTGASQDAAYYDAGRSRSGLYALGAFLALVALVIGGVLLFQALNADDSAAEPSQFALEDYTGRLLTDVTQELESLGLNFTTIAEENGDVPVGFVHRTDPVAGTVMLEGQSVQVFFNPDPLLQPVPQVIGIPLEEAQARLESEGLVVGQVTTLETDEAEENTVLESDPEPGTPVRQGSIVGLVVAGPPEGVPVPATVIGMSEIEARGILGAPPYEFNVTTALRASSTVDADLVISTDPDAGVVVPRGGDITIFVSSGPEPVTVPSVLGRTEGSARNTLAGAGLSVTDTIYVEVPPGSTDDGRVISQSPENGAIVQPGTTVTITVGRSNEVIPTQPPPTNPPATNPPPTDPPVTDPPDPPATEPPDAGGA